MRRAAGQLANAVVVFDQQNGRATMAGGIGRVGGASGYPFRANRGRKSGTWSPPRLALDLHLPATLRTIPYTVASPRPVPLPSCLVVKNGSKTRARVAASIPTPVSLTESARRSAGTSLWMAAEDSCEGQVGRLDGEAARRAGMASLALTARFMTTCSICPGSARTGQSRGAWRDTSCTSSPISAAQHALHAVDQRVQVEHPGLEQLLSAEGEELPGERRRALAAWRISSRSSRTLRPLVPRLAEHLAVAADDGEQVVEVVGDAAGQPAHRLHLLRLDELLLEFFPGDVPQEAERHALAFPHRAHHGGLDPDGLPGGRHRAELVPGGGFLAPRIRLR